jgi:hypothetical protein
MATYLLSCYGLFVKIHSYPASLGIVMDIIAQIHACIPCEASRSSLGLCLMSSLPKGKSMGTKFVKLFANRVDERRNMINDYLRGRACIESVRRVDFMESVDFELLC